jgi:cAMP phosphodiesterase
MFGHVSPPALYHELQRFARKVQSSVCVSQLDVGGDPDGRSPLSGLRVFITHIKDSLMPHPTGKCARERIMAELRELEREGKLGVEFVEVRQGDRIRE